MARQLTEKQQKFLAVLFDEAGGDMVAVELTGKYEAKSVNIDANVLKEDKEIVEDLVCAAINDAVRKIESSSKSKMSGLMSGLDLPPGFNMPGS